ncbi:MAG TPA: DNA/RNA non-specific endonuclease, partial [Pyrinomonadaceae bacterium]|nr:DNA/RNA non-specific endonuclease [Pyrinomonadaceae bacterium]
STGLSVTANLTAIGGLASQSFADGGNNSFSFTATVAPGTTPGTKSLPFTVSDAEGRTGSGTITLNVEQPAPVVEHIVISQVYGGGGNSGATYRNDYVELYNPGTTSFDVTGWSLQYAAFDGSGWESNKAYLGGVIAPGEYYLVRLASGGATGAALQPANVTGGINMSATNGKIALVKNLEGLSGADGQCPLEDPDLVDFVGYGTATCGEGGTKAPAGSNTTALFRKSNGSTDTNNNANDFVSGTPNPRQTAPIVELGPAVITTDPRSGGSNAPRDASITVTFTEAVDLAPGWFDINCAVSGRHNDAAIYSGPVSYVITPDVNFSAGEQCTVTVYAASVHDQDGDDSAANTDSLVSDHTWSFTISTGTAPPYPPSVHLTMGNPTGAVADTSKPNNYLMEKPEFALSYNRDRGTPNWVSWHLSDDWTGSLSRVDTFRPDPAVPEDWYRVLHTDYVGSGFDRGHMVPNADRDKETSIPINQATFLMTNMLPQAPDNNQGPWAVMEGYLRTLNPANELYVVAGGVGTGGAGSAGAATTIAGGRVAVPSHTWKVALVLPKDGGDDLARVTCGARTIAVIMPNVQGIRNNPWEGYLTTVDQVEALTGYDFFSNLPDAVENCVEAGTNGSNPPGTAGQTVFTPEDTPAAINLDAVSPNNNPLTYVIVSGPAHGTLTGDGENVTYTPQGDYHGDDSFTFKVNDGLRDSNISKVEISVTPVNDAPAASDDFKTTQEDTPLAFAAGDLTSNDGAGAADESGQTLSVASVTATADTHGSVSLAAGQVTYTPDADYNGPASFTYKVCDDGTTSGSPDSKCATGTVFVTVESVNDKPTLVNVPASATVNELAAYTFTAQAADVDGQALTFSLVGAPDGAAIDGATGVFTWSPTEAQGGTGSPYDFKVRVSDGEAVAEATASITVNEVNQAPVLSAIADQTVIVGGTLVFAASATDGDAPAQALTYSLVGAPAGASINSSTGVVTWAPTLAQAGQVHTFGVRVTDDGSPALSDEKAVRVGVGHTWSGVLQPVNADGSSVFKLGRTVPVKFALTGQSAGITNAVARLYVAKVTNDVTGTEEEADSTSNATEGNLFRYSDGEYVFNLSTSGLSAGTYQLRIDMGDGVLRTVRISLR